jgi:hypothetical protein
MAAETMSAVVQLLRTAGAALTALAALALPASVVATEDARADQIKAAYLFNFVKFVEWPAGALNEAIEICFAGAPGVHKSLQSAAGDKRIGSRRVAVRALTHGEAPGSCAVVYIAEDSATDEQLLVQARVTSLTVSDAPNFTRRGGAIQLFTEENRLRFVVNVENARRAGLRISSNLLKLASNVEQDGAPGEGGSADCRFAASSCCWPPSSRPSRS